jgi:hypothetical protein
VFLLLSTRCHHGTWRSLKAPRRHDVWPTIIELWFAVLPTTMLSARAQVMPDQIQPPGIGALQTPVSFVRRWSDGAHANASLDLSYSTAATPEELSGPQPCPLSDRSRMLLGRAGMNEVKDRPGRGAASHHTLDYITVACLSQEMMSSAGNASARLILWHSVKRCG